MKIKSALLTQSAYCPEHLLNELMRVLDVDTDRALAERLDVAPSSISKVRNKYLAVTSDLLLVAHLETGIPIRKLRDLMGDVSPGYWMGNLVPRRQPGRLGTLRSQRRDDTAHAGAAC